MQLELQQIQPDLQPWMTNSDEQQTQTHPENEPNIREVNIEQPTRERKNGIRHTQ